MVRDELGELRRRLEAAEADLEQMRGRRWRPSARGVLIGVGLAVLLAPVGVAATGDVLREGVRNGTTASETEIIGQFNATTGAKGGYVTRQSNTQTGPNAGGAAIYGCRGAAGGTAGGSAPCLRASNLADGLAFEFASKSGPAGVFEVASPAEAPFATNGTGLVTNLNADKIDGLDAKHLLGPQGPAGPKGDFGPRGPSDGVRKFAGDSVTDVDTAQTIETIDLAAGSWIINATVTADSAAAAGRVNASCVVQMDGTNVDSTAAWLGPQGGIAERQSLALTGGGTVGSAGTAVLVCASSDAGTDFRDASLTAIQVENLHSQ
ncbi:MAG: hypothetical protein M3370_07405 [Actinomycetota bacterium]|nr:hypothetical protein [Actinomycetota bacterium]